nr:hypothetical protein [Tanacetum cinerariifolium]
MIQTTSHLSPDVVRNIQMASPEPGGVITQYYCENVCSNCATTTRSNLTLSLSEEGLLQSPLVSPTTPLPLHQSNVDVATTFRVSLSTVGDLEVLITNIDAGEYEELLSGMTNDKHKSGVPVTMHTLSLMEEVLIHSIDDVVALFGVPLNSLKDIDEFTKDLEVGKCDLWLELTKETYSRITDIICNMWDILLNMQNSAPTVDDNLSGEATPSNIIVQSVDINTKATSYARASGASAKDGFTKETIHVEYEWMPPKCDICKIFGHVYDHCPKKVVIPPIVTTYTIFTPTIVKSNDGFQMVGKNKMRKGKSKSTNAEGTTNKGNASTSSSMLKTTSTSSKKDNISTSNSFFALNDDEEYEDEAVKNVYDESNHLLPNTKTSGNLSFMVAAG